PREVRDVASDCFILIKKAYERSRSLASASAAAKPARRPVPHPQAEPAPPRAAPQRPNRNEPLALGQPVAPPKGASQPARTFSVPSSLAPGTRTTSEPARPPRPQTPAPRSESVARPLPEALDVEEFKPSPTNLTAKDLFEG